MSRRSPWRIARIVKYKIFPNNRQINKQIDKNREGRLRWIHGRNAPYVLILRNFKEAVWVVFDLASYPSGVGELLPVPNLFEKGKTLTSPLAGLGNNTVMSIIWPLQVLYRPTTQSNCIHDIS